MDRDPHNPHIRRMLNARAFTLGMVLVLLVIVVLEQVGILNSNSMLFMLIAVAVLGLISLGMITTWFFLFLAGSSEISLGYGLRHLILSILFTPFFLFGIILIPLLVRSDLLKRRGLVNGLG